MSLSNKKREEIIKWLLMNIRDHPEDIVHLAQQQFGLSRTSILKYLKQFQEEKKIKVSGQTHDRTYSLLPEVSYEKRVENSPKLAEDKIWREDILPLLSNQKENIVRICEYGFTEIFNNAIDHSEGKFLTVHVEIYPDMIQLAIIDDGIGIFNKIQKVYNLDDPYNAILELSKGKLTTNPESHTGEGIFFTSRMFDRFVIISSKLRFGSEKKIDVLWEDDDFGKGTLVGMIISTESTRTAQSVFDEFSGVNRGFDKTVIPVSLVKYGNENLVSRSQAKRMLNRLEKFTTVLLDFKGIDQIGRAFADETFRVFANAHPGTSIMPINVTDSIDRLIKEIKENAEQEIKP